MELGVACSLAFIMTTTTITMGITMATITMVTITMEGLMWIWRVSLALFATALEGNGKVIAAVSYTAWEIHTL